MVPGVKPHILRPKKCDHVWLEPTDRGWRCHFCWKPVVVDEWPIQPLPPTERPQVPIQ